MEANESIRSIDKEKMFNQKIFLIFSLMVAVSMATPGLYGTANSVSSSEGTVFGIFVGNQFKSLVELGEYTAYQNGSDASCTVDDVFYVFGLDGNGDNVLLSFNTTDPSNSPAPITGSTDALTAYPLQNLYCVADSEGGLPYMIGVQSRSGSSGFVISYSDGTYQGILYTSELNQQYWGSAYDAVGGVVYVFSMDTGSLATIVTRYSLVAKAAQSSTLSSTSPSGLYGAVFGVDGNIYGIASSSNGLQLNLFQYAPQQNQLTIFSHSYTLAPGTELYNGPQTTMSGTSFAARYLISTPTVDMSTLLLTFDIISTSPTPVVLSNFAVESLSYVLE
ncbi:hypothetical protein DFA_04177 [Cavenderia fasciculata]|uniref:Uncharacterized protein n=1 Tax=Cavenderia fasciculata TaxID=261658 RepID=F4Q1I0_CACFS|nr:uncharacterized protein DFA_04177 [Cavenderia fasciculata]EGG18681.1 hypothetical protein DFA_04177 [Cavenderia fasciculata]|eukprot:XP_004366585.1 hypothetical protein DFA_04177 [Cavenderia fasciculata]